MAIPSEKPLAKSGKAPIFATLFMDILIGILTVIEVLVCLLLILVVMMQRPRQEGLGASFGEGMTTQMFGAQTTNVLQKFTVYLAVALFILTLTLAMLTSRNQAAKGDTKVFDDVPEEVAPAPEVPAAPVPAPAADDKKGEPAPAKAGEGEKKAEAPAKKDDSKAKSPAEPKADEAKKAEAPKAKAKAKAESEPEPLSPAPTPTPKAKPDPAPTTPPVPSGN